MRYVDLGNSSIKVSVIDFGAWVIKNPVVIALCGARNEKQALENSLAGDILLDSEDLEKFQSFINEYQKDFV